MKTCENEKFAEQKQMKRSYEELTCLLHMSGLTATKLVFVYFVVLYYVCD